LGRTSTDGYTYECSTSVYDQGGYDLCEVGDLSGKLGVLYPKGSSNAYFEKSQLQDSYPPFASNYRTSDEITDMWSSIAVSCNEDDTTLICARLHFSDDECDTKPFSDDYISDDVFENGWDLTLIIFAAVILLVMLVLTVIVFAHYCYSEPLSDDETRPLI
jgi:hypothetical protein